MTGIADRQPYSLIDLGKVYTGDRQLANIVYTLRQDVSGAEEVRYEGYIKVFSGEYYLGNYFGLTINLKNGLRANVASLQGSLAVGYFYVRLVIYD
jgi:hypothetical protein